MGTKGVKALGFSVMAALIVGGVQLAAVGQQGVKDTPGYGGQTPAKQVQGERLTSSVGIDTKQKPAPNADMAVVITSHSGDPSDPDVNWADGGFYLSKAGDGRTIHVSGNRQHHVVAKLEGYGTTTTKKTWIYEVQGLTVDKKKVFVGISAEYAGNEVRRVFLALGEDAPTDASSFRGAGYAVAGKKEP